MEPSDPIFKLRFTKPGGDAEILNVNRGVLCKSSGFYQKATRPEWAKVREQSGIIEVLDDAVQTVRTYIQWLYTGNTPIKLYEAGGDTRERVAEEAEKVFITLAEAYVFGEKIMDTKYKNVVVETILAAMDSSGWNLGPTSVDIIYEGAPSTSALRRLVADKAAHIAYDDSKDGVDWMHFFDGYPRDALRDAIKAMARVRASPADKNISIGRYLDREEQGDEEG